MTGASKNNKKYGAADFQRYHSGKMTPHEMHELEKAALEDSFLAEALDGYIHTEFPEADIADLKLQLGAKQNKGHLISLNDQKSYFRLFKIAAMILLLLGAGWLIYEFAFNKQETGISLNNKLQKPGIQERTVQTDTQQTAIEQKSLPANAKKNENNAIKPSIDVNTTTGSTNSQTKTSDEILNTQDASNDSFQINSNDQVVTIAPARSMSPLRREVSQDSTVSFKRSAPLKTENFDNPKVEISKSGNRVMITINENQDGINELVLKQSPKDSIRKSTPSIIVEEAEPEESWSSFGEYISDNLPDELKTKSVKGTLELSFDVNTSGKPVNIHVDKSLCEKCDAEALKLLKEGPNWKRKTKRGKVSFSF